MINEDDNTSTKTKNVCFDFVLILLSLRSLIYLWDKIKSPIKSTWQASFLFNNDLKAIGIGNINTFWLSQHLLRHSRWRQHGGGSAKSPARWLFHCELLRLSCIKLVDADLQTKQPLNEENNRFNEGEGYEGCVAQSWVFKEFFLFVFFWVLEMTWELLMFWACKADEEIVCD